MYELTQHARPTNRRQVAVAAIEWPTLGLIVGCHAMWLVAGLLYAAVPFLSVVLLAITIVLHSSLQHEAIHRHPTPSAGWNEALVWLPLGLLVPYRRYRTLHLLHHVDERLTDPFDDPESFYLAHSDWRRLPWIVRRLLAWNNMLCVRMVIGPLIGAATFLWADMKALSRRADPQARRRDRLAWAHHAIGLAIVAAIVHLGFAMWAWAYLLAAYLALSILAVRSFCEHRWAERPAHRIVIVERSWLGLLFLNNNLHSVHHAEPRLPWYALPRAYRERRADWRRINGGYVYRGYGEVLRRFAFRAKEPVRHPAGR
ncbi:fatty acid desaturase [Sphingomonas profundi]|uniref:fatty acid desaturase n=1 Tax=Alterirhizorhabdus profundi TaxID=2681549 RepID=UPI0012E6F0B0|nr:fatty acid desaturase [Sphingomonas profundi]